MRERSVIYMIIITLHSFQWEGLEYTAESASVAALNRFRQKHEFLNKIKCRHSLFADPHFPKRQNIQMWACQVFFGDTYAYKIYFSDTNNLKNYVSDVWSIVPLPNYRNLIFSRLVAVTVSFGIWDRLCCLLSREFYQLK